MSSPQSAGIVLLNNLSPPSPVESYATQWEKLQRPRKRQTVLDATWHDDFLVACTSLDWIYVWQVPYMDTGVCSKVKSSPIASFQVDSNASVSSIQFSTDGNDSLLVVCGMGGIVVYQWEALMQQLVKDKGAIEPTARIHTDHKVNHSLIHMGTIYAATDGGCYRYDMKTGKLLSKLLGHSGINHVAVDDGDDKTILLGSQDGTLEVYNNDDTHVETLDVKTFLKESSKNKTTTIRSYNDSKAKTWISGIHVNSPWWVVSGGMHTANKGNTPGSTGCGGFVITLHGPTRSLVSSCTTRETIQGMVSSPDKLITVANESIVSTWNPLNLISEKKGRAWCSPPSCHALAVRKQDGLVAVGGVGHVVDIFDGYIAKLFTLSLAENYGES